jgi:hypothetical protein
MQKSTEQNRNKIKLGKYKLLRFIPFLPTYILKTARPIRNLSVGLLHELNIRNTKKNIHQID